MPASSKTQPHATSGDRSANPSADLFAPPAHPPVDTALARRAATATKRNSEAQASAGSTDAAHAAAGLERLLASLQAKASSRPIRDLTSGCCVCLHGCC